MYRRKNSLRLQEFDYGTLGAYFITFCCRKRFPFLGQIKKGEVYLSPIGEILAEEWENTSIIRDQVQLDTWVIMPNHFHAVVWLADDSHLEIPAYDYLPQTPGYKNRFQAPAANLSSLVKAVKGAVTRRARAAGHTDFGWQRSFHDRIIRGQEELDRIRTYILNNPAKWYDDEWYL